MAAQKLGLICISALCVVQGTSTTTTATTSDIIITNSTSQTEFNTASDTITTIRQTTPPGSVGNATAPITQATPSNSAANATTPTTLGASTQFEPASKSSTPASTTTGNRTSQGSSAPTNTAVSTSPQPSNLVSTIANTTASISTTTELVDFAASFGNIPVAFYPNNPCVPCEYLPAEFISCDPVNKSSPGCKFRPKRAEGMTFTNVTCHVLPNITCYGPSPFQACSQTNDANRTFIKTGVPCVFCQSYSGHDFVTTLLLSIFFGVFGADRFCLGFEGTGIGKLLTLGGFGVWWLVDIALLIVGELGPENGSSWMPYW